MSAAGCTHTVTRRRALALCAVMAGAAGAAVVGKPRRDRADAPPALEALFPSRAGEWQAQSVAGSLVRPALERGRLYGIYDQVLERVYDHPQGQRVMLSVAYGSEQSAGLQVHRPEVCYPSGGFTISRLHRGALALPGHELPVTRLHASQPGRSEPITYWVVLGDQVERDERAFRWRQLALGLRGRVADGMLVRVSSLDGDAERAWRVHASFAQALASAVAPSDRPRVLGARRAATG